MMGKRVHRKGGRKQSESAKRGGDAKPGFPSDLRKAAVPERASIHRPEQGLSSSQTEP